jgi:hypothetical protein
MQRAATAALLLALLALASAPPPAAAGCKKRQAANVPAEELSFNHRPVKQLPLEELPKHFDWNNVDGRSMLVGAAGSVAGSAAASADWRLPPVPTRQRSPAPTNAPTHLA